MVRRIRAYPDYQYERIDLATDAIRLIRILQGNYDDRLRCEIFQSYLDRDIGVPYEALSYAWGKRNIPTVSMDIINEQNKPFASLWILPNLCEILKHLRHTNQDRIVWVDAICIDQAGSHVSLKERTHQVGQMRLVYKEAERVIVWLGDMPSDGVGNPGHHGTLRLEAFASQLARRSLDTSSLKSDVLSTWSWHFDDLIRLQHCGHPGACPSSTAVDDEIALAMRELLNRPWFKRVWIIQEIASAKSGIIMCGQGGHTASVPMRAFAVLPSLLEGKGLEVPAHAQAVLDVMPVAGQRRRGWWNERHDLRTLLTKFRSSQSSEPRDFVYALLGIASDTNVNNVIQPDYEIATEDLFRKTASYLISSELPNLESYTLPTDKETLIQVLNDPNGLLHGILVWAAQRNDHITAMRLLKNGPCKVDSWTRSSTYKDWLGKIQSVGDSTALIEEVLAQNDLPVASHVQSSILQLAVRKGPRDVSWLLSTRRDFDVNCRDLYGGTPLHTAVLEERHDVVKFMLEVEGIDVNITARPGETPLSTAISMNNIAATKLLLQHKYIDINRTTRQGETALSMAVSMENAAMSELLLQHQLADGNDPYNPKNPLLGKAMAFEDFEMSMTYLQERRLHIDAPEHLATPALLLLAASQERKEALDVLLQQEAGESSLTCSVLHEALRWAARRGDQRVFHRLWIYARDLHDLQDTGMAATRFSIDKFGAFVGDNKSDALDVDPDAIIKFVLESQDHSTCATPSVELVNIAAWNGHVSIIIYLLDWWLRNPTRVYDESAAQYNSVEEEE